MITMLTARPGRLGQGLRATPHHIEEGRALSRSLPGRHSATATTPGATISSPAKNRSVSSWPRSVASSATRSLYRWIDSPYQLGLKSSVGWETTR